MKTDQPNSMPLATLLEDLETAKASERNQLVEQKREILFTQGVMELTSIKEIGPHAAAIGMEYVDGILLEGHVREIKTSLYVPKANKGQTRFCNPTFPRTPHLRKTSWCVFRDGRFPGTCKKSASSWGDQDHDSF
ncbi:MAG: hypothetical protein VX768_11930 [Planctomycetota bacterium]|nr:hypothetical protein [Planctomycetota bacterium]